MASNNPIQVLLQKMVELGCPETEAMTLIMAVVQCGKTDPAAEKRRAWDRKYRQRRKADRVEKRAISGGIPPECLSGGIPPESPKIPPEFHPKVEIPIYMDNTNTVLNVLEHTLTSKQQPRTRGTRLPPDWEPSREDIEFAGTCGIPQDRIIPEAHGFRDYWIGVAGSKGCKLNWPATWRNWCRKLMETKYRSLNANIQTLFPAKPLSNFQQREQTRAATLAALTDGTIQLDAMFGNTAANSSDVRGPAQRALPPRQPDDGVLGGNNGNVHDLFRKGSQGGL